MCKAFARGAILINVPVRLVFEDQRFDVFDIALKTNELLSLAKIYINAKVKHLCYYLGLVNVLNITIS